MQLNTKSMQRNACGYRFSWERFFFFQKADQGRLIFNSSFCSSLAFEGSWFHAEFKFLVPALLGPKASTLHLKIQTSWLLRCVLGSAAQLCLILYDPTDCSPPGSSVHGICLARVLEWVAISSSRKSSPSRGQIGVSCIGRWILYHRVTWEAWLLR